MKYRGEFWTILADRVQNLYWERDGWRYAKQWRNRVGRARLTADDAIGAAYQLLRDIDPRVFRADEQDTRHLYDRAIETVYALNVQATRVSWQRFEGTR